MPHSSRWSPRSKTVRVLKQTHVHLSNCGSCIPKITATLPKATYNEETGHTTCTRKTREPLPLKRLPISYSFGVFDGYGATFGFCPRLTTSFSNRTTVLADPVAFEEPLLDTSISVVLDERGAMLSANQFGIADKDTMSACVASAKEHHEARGREIYCSF